MIVEQIYTENSLRNFNYIIACENTLEAAVIDPLRVDLLLELINTKYYKVKHIINTHEHADHTDGNQELVERTHAEVYCHANAIDKIPCAQHGLTKDDYLKIGDSVQLQVLDTPGHTMAHVCLLAQDVSSSSNQMALFCGDTLFNAGAGNVYSGNVENLYNTFVDILYKLPDDTLVYPGHDYLANNLGFTLNREPSNISAEALLKEVLDQDPHNPFVTTMGLEKKINTFFRLDNSEIKAKLSEDCSGFSVNADNRQVFYALRELRNSW